MDAFIIRVALYSFIINIIINVIVTVIVILFIFINKIEQKYLKCVRRAKKVCD